MLSQILFSVLVEGLLIINYGPGVTLLCYADDLALAFSRRDCYDQAPAALSRLYDKCREFGLKVSFAKNKVYSLY